MRRIRIVLALTICTGLGCSASSDTTSSEDDTGLEDASATATDTHETNSDSRVVTDTHPGDGATTDDTRGAADSTSAADTGAPVDGTISVDSSAADDTRPDVDSGVKTDSATGSDSAKTDTGLASTDAPPPTDGGTGSTPLIAGCRIYPPDNAWNRDVSGDALSVDNAAYLANMNVDTALHPDWGTWTDGYGIPYQSGTGAPRVKMTWTASWGAAESDHLACTDGSLFCYPIPSTVKIEGGPSAVTGADRHVLYLDTAGAPNDCTLYELYNAQNWTGPGWTAINGAIFHLGSNALRPDTWTSADAAGLPILPGLVRYDEVKAGAIKHAIRFTMARTWNAYIHPATHGASMREKYYPPMGLRLRLKAGFDVSTFDANSRVILTAMKTYGIILADNGSDWYITGDSDDRWSAIMGTVLGSLNKVHGRDFEVVDSGAAVKMPPP